MIFDARDILARSALPFDQDYLLQDEAAQSILPYLRSTPFRAVRFDALTCSVTCRSRHHRHSGADLAYLESWPAAQASARRAVHAAHESGIAIARMVAASRREGRAQRKGLPKVRPMKRTAARAS
jgi:hypothetical protein